MTRQLKICFATGTIDSMNHDGTGGVPKLIVNLANDLVDDKEVTILSSFQGDAEPQFDVSDGVTIQYIQKNLQHRSNLRVHQKLIFWLYVFVKLCIYKLNRNNRFNYVISCSPALSLMYIFLSHFTKEKVIIWENVALKRYGSLLLYIRCFFYRNASLYVTSTRSDSAFLKSKNVNFCFIPNINYSDPMKYFDRSDRKEHNHFLAVGRLVDQKNFMALLKSLELLTQTDCHWKLTLVGSGPDENRLKTFVAEHKLGHQVTFIPHVANLDTYYKKSDYLLMTSKYEGSPLVLIEAQSFSLPIVSFDCETGPKEIISDQTNGYLVENGNVEGFSNVLHELLSSNIIYDELSRSAYLNSRKFNKKSVLVNWENILT